MKVIRLDGMGSKSIDLPQYPDEAFTWYSGSPETKDEELYARVAAVYRVANLNAQALSDLPFALVETKNVGKAANKQEKQAPDYDSSDDWQNKIGIMPNPRELFRLWRMSLFYTNAFYGRLSPTNKAVRMFYCVPTTVQPVMDNERGMIREWRRGTREVYYPQDVGKKFVYGYRLDHTTELLPSKATEFRAVSAAAGIIYYSDQFTEQFYKQGAIKPTLIAMKGLVQQSTKEEIESGWTKFLRNLTRQKAKIFNAEAMDIQPFGEGLGDLKETPVYRQALENISIATGIPLSLLLANSANYATAQVEQLQWFRNTVVPWANFLADCLNEQYFERDGLHLEFRPEMTDPGQEDETQRASAYKTYVDAGIKPSVAAQIVGIELPVGVEYETLDQMKEENQQRAMEIAQAKKPAFGDSSSDKEQTKPEDKKPEPKSWAPTIDQAKELARWEGVALRKLKQGVKEWTYEPAYGGLPTDITRDIEAKIAQAETPEAIKKAFVFETQSDIVVLANAINGWAEALTKKE